MNSFIYHGITFYVGDIVKITHINRFGSRDNRCTVESIDGDGVVLRSIHSKAIVRFYPRSIRSEFIVTLFSHSILVDNATVVMSSSVKVITVYTR